MVPPEGPGSGVGSGSAAEGLMAVPRTCPGLTALVKEPWPAVAQCREEQGLLGYIAKFTGARTEISTYDFAPEEISLF